jgi:hypothetical protein
MTSNKFEHPGCSDPATNKYKKAASAPNTGTDLT